MASRRTEEIADRLRRHQLRLHSFTRGQANGIRAQLVRGVRLDLVEVLDDTDPGSPRSPARRRERLREAGTRAGEALQERFAAVNAATGRAAIQAAGVTNVLLAETMRSADERLRVSVLPDSTLRAAFGRALIDGAPTADWWRNESRVLRRNFERQVRQGIDAGESTGQLIDRVRGTVRTREGVGGIFTKRKLADWEAVVRSSVMSVNNEVRHEQFKRNRDIIRGMQLLATFDDRTCPQCGALSGSMVDLNGRPVDGGPRWPARHPPLHVACRCIAVPVIKGEEPAEDLDFADWLDRQPERVAASVLGAERLRLWREGGISFNDLVDQRGNAASLQQLREQAA